MATLPFSQLGETDIVFVGAGWGGLNGATRCLWHQQQARNLRFAVIEAGGHGQRSASRNNAGILAPNFAHSISDYAKELCALKVDAGASEDEARRETLPRMKDYMGFTLEACKTFFDFTAAHEVAIHKGPLFLVRTPSTGTKIRLLAEKLDQDFGLAPLTVLGRKDVRELLYTEGKPVYAGGWRYEMGGYFDPPQVYDSVVKSLSDRGAAIFHNCKALKVEEEGDWLRLTTSQGAIRTRFVVMTSAYNRAINPEAFARTLFYAPHAYVARLSGALKEPQGVWAFEDNGVPSYYANNTGRKLYYGAMDTIAATPWDNAYAQRKSNATTRSIWKGWGEAFQEVAGMAHRTARLATTTTGFPDLSEEWGGKVITSGGHDDRGIATASHSARVITDVLAQRLGFVFDDTGAQSDYALLKELPKGQALSEAEKAAYLKQNLPNAPPSVKRHAKNSPDVLP